MTGGREPVRALGVDLGARRIGLALSDPTGTLASPAGFIERSGDLAADHAGLARAAAEASATVVVVGMPLSLDGRLGPAARSVAAEVEQLRDALDAEVVTVDERLTTVTAHQVLRASGRSARRRPRGDVDATAAAVLLQTWLDGRRDR